MATIAVAALVPEGPAAAASRQAVGSDSDSDSSGTPASTAFARFGEDVRWSGTGCPPGTAGSSTSTGGLSVSMSFSAFLSGAGEQDRTVWTTCTTRIPVTVPAGTRLVSGEVIFRGTSDGLDPAGPARATHRVLISIGDRDAVLLEPRRQQIRPVGDFGDWTVAHRFLASTHVDRCAAWSGELTVVTELRVRGRGAEASVAQDTLDVGAMGVRLTTRPCSIATSSEGGLR